MRTFNVAESVQHIVNNTINTTIFANTTELNECNGCECSSSCVNSTSAFYIFAIAMCAVIVTVSIGIFTAYCTNRIRSKRRVYPSATRAHIYARETVPVSLDNI